MMSPIHMLTIISFAISSNLDNLGVGVAYGIRRTCIALTANATIAVMNGLGTLLSMLAGDTITRILDPGVSGVLGGLVMIGAGIWVIVQGLRNRGNRSFIKHKFYEGFRNYSRMTLTRRIWEVINNPLIINPGCKDMMGRGESIVLGLGLTMSNIVTGFAAGMIGLNALVLTLLTIFAGVLAMWFGHAAGDSRIFRWIGQYGATISGLLLVSIGILEIFI
jgi:putative sporulation protein YtaF